MIFQGEISRLFWRYLDLNVAAVAQKIVAFFLKENQRSFENKYKLNVSRLLRGLAAFPSDFWIIQGGLLWGVSTGLSWIA